MWSGNSTKAQVMISVFLSICPLAPGETDHISYGQGRVLLFLVVTTHSQKHNPVGYSNR